MGPHAARNNGRRACRPLSLVLAGCGKHSLDFLTLLLRIYIELRGRTLAIHPSYVIAWIPDHVPAGLN